MESLAQLAFNSLPLEATLHLEDFDLPGAYNWETWRSRAVREFGIPPEYFDLPLADRRNITGQFRYLEVLTKFRLTPEAATLLNRETGDIAGIYESLRGVIEAVNRDDEEMVLFFARRLNPNARSFLTQITVGSLYPGGPYARFRGGAWRALWVYLFPGARVQFSPELWEIYTEDVALGRLPLRPETYEEEELLEAMYYLVSQGMEEALHVALDVYLKSKRGKKGILRSLFLAVIRSGREDFLDSLLSVLDYPPLASVIAPVPFSVLGNTVPFSVPGNPVPFSVLGNPEPRNLARRGEGGTEHIYTPEEYYEAALYGGNIRIFYYLFFVGRQWAGFAAPYFHKKYRTAAEQGSYAHPNPAGYYQFYQYMTLNGTGIPAGRDIDINMLLLDRSCSKRGFAERVLERNEGDVDMLVNFLPMNTPRYLDRKIRSEESLLYPLSTLIIKDYLQDQTDVNEKVSSDRPALRRKHP